MSDNSVGVDSICCSAGELLVESPSYVGFNEALASVVSRRYTEGFLTSEAGRKYRQYLSTLAEFTRIPLAERSMQSFTACSLCG